MLISQLNAHPRRRKDKNVTVAGVVRASCQTPFAFFTLEDATGTCSAEQTPNFRCPALTLKSTANSSSESLRAARYRSCSLTKKRAATSHTPTLAVSMVASSQPKTRKRSQPENKARFSEIPPWA